MAGLTSMFGGQPQGSSPIENPGDPSIDPDSGDGTAMEGVEDAGSDTDAFGLQSFDGGSNQISAAGTGDSAEGGGETAPPLVGYALDGSDDTMSLE